PISKYLYGAIKILFFLLLSFSFSFSLPFSFSFFFFFSFFKLTFFTGFGGIYSCFYPLHFGFTAARMSSSLCEILHSVITSFDNLLNECTRSINAFKVIFLQFPSSQHIKDVQLFAM